MFLDKHSHIGWTAEVGKHHHSHTAQLHTELEHRKEIDVSIRHRDEEAKRLTGRDCASGTCPSVHTTTCVSGTRRAALARVLTRLREARICIKEQYDTCHWLDTPTENDWIDTGRASEARARTVTHGTCRCRNTSATVAAWIGQGAKVYEHCSSTIDITLPCSECPYLVLRKQCQYDPVHKRRHCCNRCHSMSTMDCSQ
jgi:hypothetical protein